jgi:enoyl-CoA hydratase/carnithine racemase
MPDISYSVTRGVVWIRLNRAHVKNSFTLEMIDSWAGFLRDAKADEGVGAIVVTGSGDSFCSGVDLSVMDRMVAQDDALAWKKLLADHVHQIAFTLEHLDKPVIAAVNGIALGAGMDMSLMCDMRFMARSARFCEGYIRIGAVPGDGGCYYLPRIVGVPKALELLMSGDFVDSDESLRIGLVNRVVDDAELESVTQAFAEKLCGYNPLALRMIKRTVYQSQRMDLRASLDLISSHMGIVQTNEQAAVALASFQARWKEKAGDGR